VVATKFGQYRARHYSETFEKALYVDPAQWPIQITCKPSLVSSLGEAVRLQLMTEISNANHHSYQQSVGMRLIFLLQITNALWCETGVPEYIVQWSQAMEFDPMHTPADQLALLAARVASLRSAYRTGDKPDEELADLAAAIDRDLLGWSEDTLAEGSVSSFHGVTDPDSPHGWNGTRHEYGIPQAHRRWNMYRVLRILVSRVQESVWRRSWPTLSRPPPDPEQYKNTRVRMTSDICIAAAYAFGSDNTIEPPKGSVSSGYLLIMPLSLAGSCLIEQIAEPTLTPGGSRMILVDRPLHTDPLNQTSTQLAWIIERVDYIAQKIGIKWACAVGRFLRGECRVYYDLGRS